MPLPIAAIAASALSSYAKADAAQPSIAATPDQFSPYTPINIAPVGVNIGEIMKEFNSGSPVNGGSPVSSPLYDLGWSRESKSLPSIKKSSETQTKQTDATPLILLGIAGVGVLGVVLILGRKR